MGDKVCGNEVTAIFVGYMEKRMCKTNVGDESQLSGGFEQLCLGGEKGYLEIGRIYLEIFACGMTQAFEDVRNGGRA